MLSEFLCFYLHIYVFSETTIPHSGELQRVQHRALLNPSVTCQFVTSPSYWVWESIYVDFPLNMGKIIIYIFMNSISSSYFALFVFLLTAKFSIADIPTSNFISFVLGIFALIFLSPLSTYWLISIIEINVPIVSHKAEQNRTGKVINISCFLF